MKCTFPNCDKRSISHSLCEGHNRQRLRERPLKALRDPGALPKINVGLRVSPAAQRAVKADYPGAVAALEAWAKSR